MNNKLVSIIVPVYNVEQYINRCIESIINQSYKKLEIILVDDGSTDNCPIICEDWAKKDNRIKVIHKKNGGLSDARNVGIAAATGEYIAFVDSDDWIEKQYIELLYKSAYENQALISACDVDITFEYYKNENDFSRCITEVYCTEQAIDDLIHGIKFRAVVWNKLYHFSLIKEEQFPVGKYHEDEFFTYRIIMKSKRLVFINEKLYHYYQRTGSIMNSVSLKHLDALDAYLARIACLKNNFPKIYLNDKLNFCISCSNFYRDFSKQKKEIKKTAKLKIINSRKQIHFTLIELKECSLRDLIYILGTRYFIGLLCGFLNLMKKGNL